jgi:hypothetical protein
MVKNSLLQQNPYLRDANLYNAALRVNVISSMAIEGVKKAAEKALPLGNAKTAKR